jgi:hypothetical protein
MRRLVEKVDNRDISRFAWKEYKSLVLS